MESAQLTDVIMSLRRVLRRRLRERNPDLRLPPGQFELLRVVEDHPGIGINAAARRLHLAENSVSTLVNHLVASGHLLRARDPADGRAVRLHVTGEAGARLQDWRARRRLLVEDAYARVPAEGREAISRALPALSRLLEELEGKAVAPGPA